MQYESTSISVIYLRGATCDEAAAYHGSPFWGVGDASQFEWPRRVATQDWALIFTTGSRGGVVFTVNYLRAGHNAPACLLLDLRAGFNSEECGMASPFCLAPITLRYARNDLDDSCCNSLLLHMLKLSHLRANFSLTMAV